jgi:hypothetical protein
MHSFPQAYANFLRVYFQSNVRGNGYGGRLFDKIYEDIPDIGSLTLGTRERSKALGFYMHQKTPNKIARVNDPELTRVPMIWLLYAKTPDQGWPKDILLKNSMIQKVLLAPTLLKFLLSPKKCNS